MLPGIIGTIQATETVKLILGIGEPLIGRFLIYDALRMRFRVIELPAILIAPSAEPVRRSRSFGPTRMSSAARRRRTTANKKKRTSMTAPAFGADITVTELKERMDRGDAPIILDVREPAEAEICGIPGAVLIPLGSCRRASASSTPTKEIVVHCKVGGRSAHATAYLQRADSRARAT